MTSTPPADFEIKQGDTLPALECVLTDDGAPVDLTTADEVRVQLRRNSGGLLVIDRAVTGATAEGEVTMQWQAADTVTAGDLLGEVRVKWPDDRVQTWPVSGSFRVRIRPQIG